MGQIVAGNPVDVAYQAQLAAQMANLPPDIRAYIAQQYGQSQITVLPLPYWSTMRFQASRAAGPPVAFTVDNSVRQAFSYAQGQSMEIAGFDATFRTARLADTNLLRQNETRDNADVWIWGIAAHVTPDSEPALARRIWRETACQIALNGTTQIPLGTLEMFPGAGGLTGAATTFLKQPDQLTPGPGTENGIGASLGFFQNGKPLAGNFFRLPQPFKWAAVGSAGADSSLVISAQPAAAFTESSTARTAIPTIAMISSVGTPAFTPPAAVGDLGTYVDIRWHLICVAVARRSVNV